MRQFIFLTLMLTSASAHAIIELRAGYGLNIVNPDKMNALHSSYNASKVPNLAGFNLDAMVSLPAIPIGFGFRYESMSAEGNGTSAVGEYKYSAAFTRTSLLVNYRLIDTLIYVGPISSIGIVNNAEYSNDVSGVKSKYSAEGSTFSIAAEGGAKLGTLVLGGELGYLFADFGNGRRNGGDLMFESQSVALDYSGPYFKLMAGVGF